MRTTTIRKQNVRQRRTMRVRKRLRGDAQKPRLCVVKTNMHLEAQLIDDEKHVTLGSISTIAKEFRGTEFGRKSKKAAKKIGERIAEIAKKYDIEEVIFDRGPSKYHGVLAELADAARAGGLKF